MALVASSCSTIAIGCTAVAASRSGGPSSVIAAASSSCEASSRSISSRRSAPPQPSCASSECARESAEIQLEGEKKLYENGRSTTFILFQREN